MHTDTHIITIGYAGTLLEKHSRQFARLRQYATLVHSFHAIVFSTKSTKPSVVTDGNFTVLGTHARTKLGKLWGAYRMVNAALKDNPDATFIISAQDPFETSLVTRLFARHPRVTVHVQVHGDFFGSPYWRRESWLNRVRYWWGKRVVRRVSRIRVVSKRIKDSLIALGVPAARITVLPVQGTLESFSPRDTYADTSPITFLYVGRFAAEKNILGILRAFKEARTAVPSCTLQLVGGGPEEDAIRTYITQHRLTEVVTITPWTEDVAPIMRAADVYVLNSWHEGHAMVLIEAMASGLPLITTNVGCVGDTVQHAVHGHVIAPGDGAALTAAMIALASSYDTRVAYRTQGLAAAHTIAATPDAAYAEAWVDALTADAEQV